MNYERPTSAIVKAQRNTISLRVIVLESIQREPYFHKNFLFARKREKENVQIGVDARQGSGGMTDSQNVLAHSCTGAPTRDLPAPSILEKVRACTDLQGTARRRVNPLP